MNIKADYVLSVCSLGVNPNLSGCLDALVGIKASSEREIEIVLVLNCNNSNLEFDPHVQVCLEPARGYSKVRNRLLSVVSDSSNLIFIDDDEMPTIDWFEELVAMHEKYPKDVLIGPVYPFSSPGNSMITYRGQFSKNYLRRPNESLIHSGPTANMLVPSSVLQSPFCYFDEFFNLSGSEDTDFCYRIRNQGFNIRYSKKAVIYEIESVERLDSEYILERKMKDYSNFSVVIKRNASLCQILRRAAIMLMRIATLTLLFPLSAKVRGCRRLYISAFKSLIYGNLYMYPRK